MSPYCDCDNLTKTPGVGDAVRGKPGKVSTEDYEEAYVDTEYCGIEEDDEEQFERREPICGPDDGFFCEESTDMELLASTFRDLCEPFGFCP